jgi:hypothetical protein
MGTASLNNMSVPAADNSRPSQGLLMPKLQYRFRATFTNFGIGGGSTAPITQQVMDFARPNLTFDNIDLPIYNSTVKIAGKHSWTDITCKIRDDAQGTASTLVAGQLQKQLDFNEQSSSQAGIDYKFTVTFEVLDGGNGNNNPTVLETWNIYGAYLQGVNYDAANYGTNEVMTISMTIRYDNAEQVLSNGLGVGTTSTSSVPGQGQPGQPIATG